MLLSLSCKAIPSYLTSNQNQYKKHHKYHREYRQGKKYHQQHYGSKQSILGHLLFCGVVVGSSLYLSKEKETIKKQMLSFPAIKDIYRQIIVTKRSVSKTVNPYVPPGFKNPSKARMFVNYMIGINTAVFVTWFLYPSFASRYFLHTLYSPSYTLLTSAFSHSSWLHFLVNMICLNSFALVGYSYLGPQELTAFFLSSAVVSSLASHFHMLFSSGSAGGLGISGVLFALLGLFSQISPDAEVSLFFVIPITLKNAVIGAAIFDLVLLKFH
eukprot:TRINITY_DN673_c0_g1_i2.p1 TRINITY_DN673_c0_g1~~TRINITY_DN673_c0_g1_i2.p1  ORF type:complete len:270 (+),score=18.53 TRINITY_DN673_c0_g1_i2:1012-1821(+)